MGDGNLSSPALCCSRSRVFLPVPSRQSILCAWHRKPSEGIRCFPGAVLYNHLLLIIVICYSKVFITVRKHNANLHHRESTGPNPARLTVEEIDLTNTLTCVVLGFVNCWTPVVTVDMIDFVNRDWLLSRHVYVAYTCFSFGSAAMNPIIYGFQNRASKREYYNIFTSCLRIPWNVSVNTSCKAPVSWDWPSP